MNNSNVSILADVELIKASFYLLDFLICCTFTILITQTIWRDNTLKKEVRYFFLCHHLMCLTLFFLTGTVFSFLRALQVNAPAIVCWMVFAVQIAIGRGLLMTLVLMALNTCIAVCWPLRYLVFVHAVKQKIMVVLWIVSFLDPVVSVLYEIAVKGPKSSITLDPSCPTTLSSTLARITAFVFIIVLVTLLFVSYVVMYREGKRAGHFTNSNHQARRTILIHGLQVALHIIPTFISIWFGGKKERPVLEVVSFIIFSFAQCFSPVVYGLRSTQLRDKFTAQYPCCAKHTSAEHETENIENRQTAN